MRRHLTPSRPRALAASLTAMLGASLAASGCESGGGAPSVSSSTTEATVHGTVKYKGTPINEGQIVFDPANIQRKSAAAVSAPLGKDGSYSVKTLVGGNSINFRLPALEKKDPSLAYATILFDVPGGDTTKDIDLPLTNP
jgi:hypothetical protein